MLTYRAWELRTIRVKMPEINENYTPDLTFRHLERNVLYLIKHIVQIIILDIAHTWFTVTTKTKKWIKAHWPHVHNYVEKKLEPVPPEKYSFVRRAINESKVKIKRVREKVKKEHAEEVITDNII